MRISVEYSSAFPAVPFQGHGLYWLVSTRAGVISHHIWSWCSLPAFAAFLSLDLKYHWGLDVICRKERSGGLNSMTGNMPGEERLPRGQGPLPVHPLLGTQGFLYLAVNCLASLFSFPLFPHSTCQEIFLASFYLVSTDFSDPVSVRNFVQL